ncbi:hypothetical protein FJR48_05550 [Sulfurimonas lithotrophica]|uniref:DUF5644 domain-containing protein n=1 Tax=Sulfurimonas lithotrophica TaxID=2590022 RepID=A0A5P8P0T4_9BACT|nr:DUF5644 domain-containing protein [Sulfurimonas lithotrophica]QFR49220.1 hypothetical protein FJR48_05550 [Sulfurimonas lithotrophica]
MNNKLNIEVYKFNHEQDYLPYYKYYSIDYSLNDTLDDILTNINSVEKLSYEKGCNVVINNLFVNTSETIENIIKKTGNNLTIEPISKYRCKNDLIINKDDYLNKLNRFNQFLNDEELNKYKKSLELMYYSSNTINYNRDYIGDHSLVIAYDIINTKPEFKESILNILSEANTGIYHYTSSKNRLFSYDANIEEKVEFLFELVTEYTKPSLTQNKYISKLYEKFKKQEIETKTVISQNNVEIKQSFEGFNIAYYSVDRDLDIESFIEKSKASLVKTNMQHANLPKRVYKQNTRLIYMIAADILLEAKDNNADFIIIKDETLVDVFDKEQDKLASLSGREIDLSIITYNQFLMLLNGEKDKAVLGLDKNKVKIEFLASA